MKTIAPQTHHPWPSHLFQHSDASTLLTDHICVYLIISLVMLDTYSCVKSVWLGLFLWLVYRGNYNPVHPPTANAYPHRDCMGRNAWFHMWQVSGSQTSEIISTDIFFICVVTFLGIRGWARYLYTRDMGAYGDHFWNRIETLCPPSSLLDHRACCDDIAALIHSLRFCHYLWFARAEGFQLCNLQTLLPFGVRGVDERKLLPINNCHNQARPDCSPLLADNLSLGSVELMLWVVFWSGFDYRMPYSPPCYTQCTRPDSDLFYAVHGDETFLLGI